MILVSDQTPEELAREETQALKKTPDGRDRLAMAQRLRDPENYILACAAGRRTRFAMSIFGKELYFPKTLAREAALRAYYPDAQWIEILS